MRHFINIALVLAFSAPAQAQLPNLTYNAFSAGFTRTDVDHATEDADSLTVGLSYEISETFHLWGQLDRTTLDHVIEFPFFTDDVIEDYPGIGFPPVETKVRSLGLAVGGGFHNDLTDSLSGYARLGFVYADTDTEVGVSTFETVFEDTGVSFGGGGVTMTDSSTDFVLSAGLRYKAADWLELFGGLSQVGGDSTTGHAGVEFWIANGWGAQLAGVLGDNSQGISLGVVRRF